MNFNKVKLFRISLALYVKIRKLFWYTFFMVNFVIERFNQSLKETKEDQKRLFTMYATHVFPDSKYRLAEVN